MGTASLSSLRTRMLGTRNRPPCGEALKTVRELVLAEIPQDGHEESVSTEITQRCLTCVSQTQPSGGGKGKGKGKDVGSP